MILPPVVFPVYTPYVFVCVCVILYFYIDKNLREVNLQLIQYLYQMYPTVCGQHWIHPGDRKV